MFIEKTPTLNEIARGLADEVRFARQTRERWTVLQHSLAVEAYAELSDWPKIVRLHALLHDAHEAVTGDIPHPWKTPDMRALQQKLDVRIWESLDVSPPGMLVQRMVDLADAEILLAEADRLCEPNVRWDVTDWLGWDTPSAEAVMAVDKAYRETEGLGFDALVALFESRVVTMLNQVSETEGH